MICHVQKGKYGASLAFVRGCNLVIRAFFLDSAQLSRGKATKNDYPVLMCDYGIITYAWAVEAA